MKTLEEILQQDFNCKRPFYKNPTYDANGNREHLTVSGGKAYDKLIDLFYQVGALTEMKSEVNEIVERLDEIVDEEY